MSWIKKRFLKSLILLSSIFVALFIVEALLRLTAPKQNWGKLYEANILRNFEYEYDIGHIYSSENSVVKYVRNEFGLRDNCGDVKDIEILTVGGSTTDQRYVPFEYTYQTILQNELKKIDSNFGCVSNAGVDGHSTYGHLFSFQEWFPLIPNLQPKFVLLYVGINDANFQNFNPGYDTSSGLKGLLKEFELIRQLMPLYKYLKQKIDGGKCVQCGHLPKSYTETDYVIAEMNFDSEKFAEANAKVFESRITQLFGQIKNINAIPICVTQPHRFVRERAGKAYGLKLGENFSGLDYDYSIKRLNAVLMKHCGNNTLDLHNFNFSDDDFYDSVHTTAAGSIKIGQAMADFIKKRFYNN
jgi:lysophospholipase L1-like esterase